MNDFNEDAVIGSRVSAASGRLRHRGWQRHSRRGKASGFRFGKGSLKRKTSPSTSHYGSLGLFGYQQRP